jgi:hypothetical protein
VRHSGEQQNDNSFCYEVLEERIRVNMFIFGRFSCI